MQADAPILELPQERPPKYCATCGVMTKSAVCPIGGFARVGGGRDHDRWTLVGATWMRTGRVSTDLCATCAKPLSDIVHDPGHLDFEHDWQQERRVKDDPLIPQWEERRRGGVAQHRVQDIPSPRQINVVSMLVGFYTSDEMVERTLARLSVDELLELANDLSSMLTLVEKRAQQRLQEQP